MAPEGYARLMAFCAGLHDLGKFSRPFQWKVPELWPDLLGPRPVERPAGPNHWKMTALHLRPHSPLATRFRDYFPNLAPGYEAPVGDCRASWRAAGGLRWPVAMGAGRNRSPLRVRRRRGICARGGIDPPFTCRALRRGWRLLAVVASIRLDDARRLGWVRRGLLRARAARYCTRRLLERTLTARNTAPTAASKPLIIAPTPRSELDPGFRTIG